MKELSLHILDLSMNSVRANCSKLEISIEESTNDDSVKIFISDDGDGMDKEFLERVCDPFTTTRTTRKVGLGIPLIKANAEACDGYFRINSEPEKGTKIEVQFKLSHIDRPIMGNIPSVASMLFCNDDNLNVIFSYKVDENNFSLSSEEIKDELGDVSVLEPGVKYLIEKIIYSGILALKPQA